MVVKAITSLAEYHTIIRGNGGNPVVIMYHAHWCGPCRMMLPLFYNFSDQIDGVDCYSVHIDERQDIAADYNVQSIPMFAGFYQGQKVDVYEGRNTAPVIALLEKMKACA